MTIALNRSSTPRRSWRKRLAGWVRGPTLARDIAIVLAIKFVLLMALKYTFFNHPQAEHMSMPPEQVAQALLSVPASHPSQGDQHAR
ncbi:cytochrome oxidase putative small subunit CydP [Paraburkholderia sp. BCC1884]|uniref:cytochrome oxidase putative small subunit CydP n=1 Tax=Paraburkholderia sp. BCC1884 TaxID=2562668 RepID=UPI0011835DAD|nr:cytochrome oxidase putative small subunit CydP [Paraburkholderia sp. BCC1884]